MTNSVLTFLKENEQQLDLARFGNPDTFNAVIATPRFKASSHLIFFIFDGGQSQPALIAKIPRIAGDHERLEGETARLNHLQALWAGGISSAPEVVAFENYCGHYMLVETAVSGQTMRPSFVRAKFETALNAGITWLTGLHKISCHEPENRMRWFQSCVQEPLACLQPLADDCVEDKACLDETLRMANELSRSNIPSVFEHGDFSSPNLLMSDDDQLGVVDWELAIPAGLPMIDLFFLLSYLAFAKEDARGLKAQMQAFENAFLKPEAWAMPHVRTYADAFKLPRECVAALFVVCWGRYVASLLNRLAAGVERKNGLTFETINWLRTNRYYHLWRTAVSRFADFQGALN